MKTIAVGRPVDAAEEALIKEARRRQRRRQYAIGAGVVLALAGGAAALRGTSHPRPPSAHHSTSSPKQLPAKMTGLPMPAGTNLRLLLETATKTGLGQAAWYSTATRQREPIAHLPAANYDFNRVGGGWSVITSRQSSPCAAYQCAGPPRQVYFIADGSLTATRIGAGFWVLASGRDGAVWLASYPRSTDNIRTTPARIQLVSTTGQPLSPRYRLPAAYLVVGGGVGNYLLLTPVRSRPPYASELWDPRTGQVVRRVDNVIAAGPGQIAWSPGCRGCRAQVLNVSTGKSMTIPIHGGQLSGFFSDDGRLLAVQLPDHGACQATPTGSTCSGIGGALGVFDTETGAFTMLPGTALRFSVAQSFSWQNGGHRLIVLAEPGNSFSDTTQLGYWDPGDTRLRVATIQIPGGGLGAVVTAYPGQ